MSLKKFCLKYLNVFKILDNTLHKYFSSIMFDLCG
jgi:hypothetical protein